MIRIFLFLLTNLAIMLVLGIIFICIGLNISNVLNILIISLIFGFLGSIISLLVSKWIALYSVGGVVINVPRNNIEKWLFQIVEKHSKNVNISAPEIAIYTSLDMNAFATGAQKNSSLIALSSELIRSMNKNEIEAIIAHEITHIANGDMVTMTLIQGITNTFILFISRIIMKIFTGILPKENENNEDSFSGYQYSYYSFILTVLESTLGVLASLITMWFSRTREYYADAGSAKLVGSKNMISALKKLKYSLKPREPDIIMTLCINGRLLHPILHLFSSHPAIDMRINALKKNIYA